MCSTVAFRYKCGCTERTVIECQSSSTRPNARDNAQTKSKHSCGWQCLRHEWGLIRSSRPRALMMTDISSSSADDAPSPSSHGEGPVTAPLRPSFAEWAASQKQERETVLDELCHDCEEKRLKLKSEKNDGNDASATAQNVEGQPNDHINPRLLQNISLNVRLVPVPRRRAAGVGQRNPTENLM